MGFQSQIGCHSYWTKSCSTSFFCSFLPDLSCTYWDSCFLDVLCVMVMYFRINCFKAIKHDCMRNACFSNDSLINWGKLSKISPGSVVQISMAYNCQDCVVAVIVQGGSYYFVVVFKAAWNIHGVPYSTLIRYFYCVYALRWCAVVLSELQFVRLLK